MPDVEGTFFLHAAFDYEQAHAARYAELRNMMLKKGKVLWDEIKSCKPAGKEYIFGTARIYRTRTIA